MEAHKTDSVSYSSGGQNITEVADQGKVLIVADILDQEQWQ